MRRIQMSRQRPWRAEHPDAIVVARPTRWGNPFKVGALIVDPGWWNQPACPYDGGGGMAPGTYTAHNLRGEPYEYQIRPVRDRADAVRLFREYITFHDDEWPPEVIRRELGGRDLACWCPLDQPCHADVLLEICRG